MTEPPTLAWSEAGRAGGPPLVLLNSIGTTTAMWEPCLLPLAERYRLIRIDHPGHGQSPPRRSGGKLSLADLGTGVLQALDELGLNRVHLAGLSLGGMVGMWLAAHHPDRVARLALLCTTTQMASPAGYRQRADTVRQNGLAAIADQALGLWLTPALAERDPELGRSLIDMLTGVDAESYAQCCEVLADLQLQSDLARIASPTLVIAAADDRATPPAMAETIAAGIAGARLEQVPDAAHLATVEQPGRIAQLLVHHFGPDGMTNRRAVLGDAHVDRANAGLTEFNESFQDFITRYAWGEIWGRPGLGWRERSIATLAALVSLGADHEIGLHVRGALANGLTPAEIAEVLQHTAVYAGVPRANRAFAIAQQIMEEER